VFVFKVAIISIFNSKELLTKCFCVYSDTQFWLLV